MRVTGGELRGRRLGAVPEGVRPTSDRVREAIFSALGDVDGLRVLDLYAGTGALGIEALSRGASAATFVDRAVRSLRALRSNLAALALVDRARLQRAEARRRLAVLGAAGERFDLVFVDPPYDSGELEPALAALRDSGVLSASATVVVESATRHPWTAVVGFRVIAERRYGDTRVTRLAPEAASLR